MVVPPTTIRQGPFALWRGEVIEMIEKSDDAA